jgi:hypothetical protein
MKSYLIFLEKKTLFFTSRKILPWSIQTLLAWKYFPSLSGKDFQVLNEVQPALFRMLKYLLSLLEYMLPSDSNQHLKNYKKRVFP